MSVIRNILNSTKALVSNSLPTTGSNTFVGTQTMSGSILPATNNAYDLGDVSRQFRHLYLSSGSLYIDGQKVLGSTGNELQITTDNGQSIKILEAGSDNIILQSADGNIELKTSGGGDVILDPTSGVIGVKGTMTIYSGNKLLSSDGAAIQIGNDLGITGSIVTTGNINGINLSTFSSSIASTFSNQNTATSSYETKGRGIVSGSSQVLGGSGVLSGSAQLENATITNLTITNLTTINETASVIFSSGSNRFGDFGDDIHDFTGSVKISGSFTLVGSSTATSYNGTINATNGVVSGSTQTIANLPTGTVSGSSQVVSILSSLNTYTGSNDTTTTAQNNRLTSIESATGSYETKGRSIVSGSSQITFSGISSLPTLVSGSSQVTLSSTTGYGSVLNQALLTTSTPTFAGITANGHIYATNGSISFGGTSSPPTTDPAIYRVAGNDLVVAIGSSERVRIASTGTSTFSGNVEFANGYKIRMQNPSMMIDALTPSYFGYSSGYGTLIVGHTGNNNRSIAFGVDVSANASGAFTGLGNEYIWRGAASFITPNSSNNGYNTLFSWNSSGQMTFVQNATFSGTITENSSIRYKENIEPIKYGLDKVLQMRGVTYNKKDNGVKEIGVIAEEIYDVLPEVVLKNEEGEIDSVSYGRITAVLIEAIKDLKKEIEDLKANR